MARLLLVFMLLVPLVIAGYQPVRALERSEVTFTFGEGVSAADEALIREGIRYAQEYALGAFGRATERAIEVDARPVQEFGVSGYVLGNTIYLATGNPVWVETPPMRRLKIVIHEYFHLIQIEHIRYPSLVPVWLMEGSAELFAFEAVAALGLVDINAVVDQWIYGMWNDPSIAGVPLDAMAQPEPSVGCCLYSVSPLAVRELLRSGGWPSFLAYIEEFNTMPPDDSFTEKFGMTLDEFYALFAGTRQQMFAAGYDVTALRLPWYPVEWGADVWNVSARTPVERGGQAFLTAWSVPGVPCSLTFTSASGNLLLTQETHANQDGLVFWLWSVRSRLSEGDARADITCGTNVLSATIELT